MDNFLVPKKGGALQNQKQNEDTNTIPRRNVMSAIYSRIAIASAAVALLASTSTGALAQEKYYPGASDTEIKIGNIMPYSGPASAYGVIGKMEEAYFKMINDQGGINGRKIKLIVEDSGYDPKRAVLASQKLIEKDKIFAMVFFSNKRRNLNRAKPRDPSSRSFH